MNGKLELEAGHLLSIAMQKAAVLIFSFQIEFSLKNSGIKPSDNLAIPFIYSPSQLEGVVYGLSTSHADSTVVSTQNTVADSVQVQFCHP